MNPIIIEIIKRSNKTTIQNLVRDYSIERLGYMNPEIIEDAFNVKRGTASFGIAVSELFEPYKVDKAKLWELDTLIRQSSMKVKNTFRIEVKKEQTRIHNNAVDLYRELHKPLTKFVNEINKYYRNEK